MPESEEKALSLAYDIGHLQLLNRATDWVADTIKAMYVNSSYIPNAAHQFVDSGSGGANPSANENSGTGYTRQTLAGKAILLDSINHRVGWFANNLVNAAANGWTTNGVIIFRSTGVDTTSPLLFFIDAGFPQTAASGLTVLWGSAGVATDT